MDIINHPSVTRLLPPPESLDKSVQCDVLPVAEIEADGLKWMISYWKPSADELKALAAGALIALHVNASTNEEHPIVGLGLAWP